MKIKVTGLQLLVMVLAVFLLCQSAAAVGVWKSGTITRAPWSDASYNYLAIDNVTYTIMPDAKMALVYQKEGATYKSPISASTLQRGDQVVAKIQGNRIYQLEKTKNNR
jgi:hypothetical protein